jgi:hypothetical protein
MMTRRRFLIAGAGAGAYALAIGCRGQSGKAVDGHYEVTHTEEE